MLRVRNPSCYAYPASTGHPSATARGEKIGSVSCLFLYKFLSLSLSHTHTHTLGWQPPKVRPMEASSITAYWKVLPTWSEGVGQCLQDKMQRLCKISHSHTAQRACVIALTHPHAHTFCLFNMARAQLTHTHTHTHTHTKQQLAPVVYV